MGHNFWKLLQTDCFWVLPIISHTSEKQLNSTSEILESLFCRVGKYLFYVLLADPDESWGCSTKTNVITRFGKKVSHPLSSTALRRRQTQTVRNGASSHKIDYVRQVQGIPNLKGYQNCIIGSIFVLNWCILPIGWLASRRVCACRLRTRVVFLRALDKWWTSTR